ncbi:MULTISPECIES: SPFH domain-containing protein [unclassified Streptomyces]|uniref:SPFH domain-containing protein n=2 Tax=Streptomyces TaxID=1883 RepID=UPI0027D9193F|nr:MULTISPECIES: SPFH domain-containing protein [unclassified Streptomyces]MDX3488614.1 SPFH domain-containing protein [Streptomyces sp. ID05-18]
MTPNDDQTPRTSPTPTPHSLDDQLPPSLFDPPGRGSPPPLFGPAVDRTPPPDRELPPRPAAEPAPASGPASEPVSEPASASASEPKPGPDAGLPPLFGRADRDPAEAGKVPPAPPRTASPEPPNVSLHLGPAPDRRTTGPTPATASDGRPEDARAGERPTSGRPAPDRRTTGPTPATAADGRPAPGGPGGDRPTPARPVPLDGNLHLKPVRRLRTEPSAEWTPHPSYGAEPEPGKGPARKAPAGRGPEGAPARGSVDGPGPDTELDLVLDLAPGDRAASATFSVPVSLPVPTSPTAATPSYPGRRHSVIANETTASIPVHLLFRDDQEPVEPAEPGAVLPAAVVHRPATGDRSPATRRPPVPRSPQTRVQPPTRPAPVADPRLAERPGPALPGYAALLVGAAGIAGGLAVLWWRGALPAAWQTAVGLTPRADLGVGFGAWALLALLATVVLLALGGLGRGRVGYAWVLTLFGDYRGSVRRTGLVWVSPLLLRRRVDVRLRHWRSEPLPAVDANGTALRVVVLVVWRIKDTVRAVLGIEDHEAYLSAQVEAAMARVLSQLPADAFHEDAPSLRDAEAVGDALTRMLKADCEPVGVEVYSAQPTGIEYAPEVAAAMQRRRIAAIDSKHRDSVLTSVVDAVDDTVNRLTTRGIVELDDYERKALVKDLTVAFYTGRSGGGDVA